MGKKYQKREIDTSALAVPETVSVALAELAGEVREGLLDLAVGTGLQVMAAIMEEDVTARCGPKGRRDPVPGSDPARPGRGVGELGWAPGTDRAATDARDRWRGRAAAAQL